MGRDDITEVGTTLDLLEAEDLEVRALFEKLAATQGASVEERAAHGDLSKQLVRHVATREAALTDVVGALRDVPALTDVAERMDLVTGERRNLIDQIEHMSRGVQGMYLNTGQDFDGAVAELARLMSSEIEWEVTNGIPAIRELTDRSTRKEALHSAAHGVRHAPTNVSPTKSRWYERAPVISRVITLYDHLRDFPKASKGALR